MAAPLLVIAAGGTGGHMFPAQALAEEMLARLYEQQRHVALTLQRSLMGSPPDVPGMPTASRHFPARPGGSA